MNAVPVVPGVPAAGHLARGFWHPGPADGCAKCPPPPRPVSRETSPEPDAPCCRRLPPTNPANHNRAVRERGRCPCWCHAPRAAP